MDDKKLSSKWHPILALVAIPVLLSLYPLWHVFLSEDLVVQSRHPDGMIAKVVVHYSPSSLRSYLGAYFPEMRRCGIKLIVKDRNGVTARTAEVLHGCDYESPSDILVWLNWNAEGTELYVWTVPGQNRQMRVIKHVQVGL